MWGDDHQQGQLLYDEEITKGSIHTIQEVPDRIDEVPKNIEDKKTS